MAPKMLFKIPTGVKDKEGWGHQIQNTVQNLNLVAYRFVLRNCSKLCHLIWIFLYRELNQIRQHMHCKHNIAKYYDVLQAVQVI